LPPTGPAKPVLAILKIYMPQRVNGLFTMQC
jgi:hypothetical protein